MQGCISWLLIIKQDFDGPAMIDGQGNSGAVVRPGILSIAMPHYPLPCLSLGVLTADGKDLVFVVTSSVDEDQEMRLNCLHAFREDI